MSHDQIDEGPALRRKLQGEDHYEARSEDLAAWVRTFEQAEIDHVWSPYWTRPALDARSRSICVLSILIALGFLDDFEQMLRGVLAQRVLSKEEVRELILQCPGYVGYPRTLGARKIAERLLAEVED